MPRVSVILSVQEDAVDEEFEGIVGCDDDRGLFSGFGPWGRVYPCLPEDPLDVSGDLRGRIRGRVLGRPDP